VSSDRFQVTSSSSQSTCMDCEIKSHGACTHLHIHSHACMLARKRNPFSLTITFTFSQVHSLFSLMRTHMHTHNCKLFFSHACMLFVSCMRAHVPFSICIHAKNPLLALLIHHMCSDIHILFYFHVYTCIDMYVSCRKRYCNRSGLLKWPEKSTDSESEEYVNKNCVPLMVRV
jgi:hypothetical protein